MAGLYQLEEAQGLRRMVMGHDSLVVVRFYLSLARAVAPDSLVVVRFYKFILLCQPRGAD